jgi:hypothetical protein
MNKLVLRTLIAAGLGSLSITATGAEISGGITGIAQWSNDSRIKHGLTASADLSIEHKQGSGTWTIDLEASSTVRSNRVAGALAESNGDAGSAVDSDDHGRLQISGLNYRFRSSAGTITLGLVDPTAFLDGNDVANDETAQFVSATLVNNPSIEFPDYTLGVSLQREGDANRIGYTLFLAGSHGLGDNPKRSYQHLFELNDSDKGLFAAAEIQWPLAALTVRTGIWVHTGDHTRLDSTGNENNYGLYANIDGGKNLRWNVRLGASNKDVYQAARFLSVAVQKPVGNNTLGAGISWTGISNVGKTAGQDDTVQAEVYYKVTVSKQLELTPSLQWLQNSAFDSSGSSYDARQTILSLRINYSF